MPLAFQQRVKDRSMMHSATKEFIQEVLTRYRDSGFKNIKKKYTKALYKEIIAKHPVTEVIPVYSKENKLEQKEFQF